MIPQAPPRTVLIVEDEVFVALDLEDMLIADGCSVIGVVVDHAGLGSIIEQPRLAFVDLNLRDGLTGPGIAHALSDAYATWIVYVTANPSQIGTPAPTALAVIQKPFSRDAVHAVARMVFDGEGLDGALAHEVGLFPATHLTRQWQQGPAGVITAAWPPLECGASHKARQLANRSPTRPRAGARY